MMRSGRRDMGGGFSLVGAIAEQLFRGRHLTRGIPGLIRASSVRLFLPPTHLLVASYASPSSTSGDSRSTRRPRGPTALAQSDRGEVVHGEL